AGPPARARARVDGAIPLGPAARCRQGSAQAMSWAAHQFEGYVLQKHFGSKVRISYLAIVAGDLLPDKFVKSWVYGFTIDGHHFGTHDPAHFHRGWPGAGFTHTMFMGVVVGTLVWLFGRHRAWG